MQENISHSINYPQNDPIYHIRYIIPHVEIFELQPISWSFYSDPKKYALAEEQLHHYISAYKRA
jgi:hypothetical protein